MDLTHPSLRRATQACGASVAVAGVAALVGWATEQSVLLGLRANYIPMAPNTALAFIVLGLGLFIVVSRWRAGHGFAGLGAALVGLVGVLRLSEYAAGGEFAVDRWFFHVHGGQLGLAPIGKMSLPTAVAFVAASSAMLALAWPARPRSVGHAAGAFGLIAGMIGLVFSLGYLFSPNAPLLYGSESIPMALEHRPLFPQLGCGVGRGRRAGSVPAAAVVRVVDPAPACCGFSSRWWWGPSAWSPG